MADLTCARQAAPGRPPSDPDTNHTAVVPAPMFGCCHLLEIEPEAGGCAVCAAFGIHPDETTDELDADSWHQGADLEVGL